MVTDFHRYVFLVFEQQWSLNVPVMNATARFGVDLKGFCASNGLGDAMAGNYFRAKADQLSIDFWKSYNPAA